MTKSLIAGVISMKQFPADGCGLQQTEVLTVGVVFIRSRGVLQTCGFLPLDLSFPAVEDMGGSPSDVSEEPMTQEIRKMDWRMSFDVGEAT